jgi:hypothetical protein
MEMEMDSAMDSVMGWMMGWQTEKVMRLGWPTRCEHWA